MNEPYYSNDDADGWGSDFDDEDDQFSARDFNNVQKAPSNDSYYEENYHKSNHTEKENTSFKNRFSTGKDVFFQGDCSAPPRKSSLADNVTNKRLPPIPPMKTKTTSFVQGVASPSKEKIINQSIDGDDGYYEINENDSERKVSSNDIKHFFEGLNKLQTKNVQNNATCNTTVQNNVSCITPVPKNATCTTPVPKNATCISPVQNNAGQDLDIDNVYEVSDCTPSYEKSNDVSCNVPYGSKPLSSIQSQIQELEPRTTNITNNARHQNVFQKNSANHMVTQANQQHLSRQISGAIDNSMSMPEENYEVLEAGSVNECDSYGTDSYSSSVESTEPRYKVSNPMMEAIIQKSLSNKSKQKKQESSFVNSLERTLIEPGIRTNDNIHRDEKKFLTQNKPNPSPESKPALPLRDKHHSQTSCLTPDIPKKPSQAPWVQQQSTLPGKTINNSYKNINETVQDQHKANTLPGSKPPIPLRGTHDSQTSKDLCLTPDIHTKPSKAPWLQQRPTLNEKDNNNSYKDSKTRSKKPSTSSLIKELKTCVALYSYHDSVDDGISFSEGDIITILDDSDPEWFYGATSQNTGHFPKTYVQIIKKEKRQSSVSKCLSDISQFSWYGGSMDRKGAELKLKEQKKEGSFFIRETDKGSGYSISIFCGGTITHLRVPFKDGGYFLGDSGKEKFSSVEEMVRHHKTNKVYFKSGAKTYLFVD